jgi:polysaccharide export outer membrane protein
MPARHTEPDTQRVASVARNRDMRGREQRPEKLQCPLADLGNWRGLRTFAKRGTILLTPVLGRGRAMTFLRLAAQTKALGRKGVLLSSVLLCSAIPAKAEYRVDVGDVLEIAVAGVPELRQRVAVQLDGSISYPLLDTFMVAGLPPSEVRAKIRAILPTKVFRLRAPDGRENVVVIEPDQVTANVVEYRPIYVNGDVSRPGEQVYRPLMTVHQAVALAGGYEIMRFRMNNPFLDSADFRSDYESLWIEFAKEQAHIWRVRADLGEKDSLDPNVLRDVPIPADTISQIARLEAEQLKARQDDYLREKEFLLHGIKQADEQTGVLSEQLQKEEAGLQADTQDLQRVTELFSKGAVPILRITDSRRAVLLSSTRKLQTISQLMTTKKQRDDFSRQLERLDDLRRINLHQELQDAGVKLNQIRAKLQGVGEKLQYTALVRSQLIRGAGSKPQITIARKEKKNWERFAAEEDSELQPGDVVEVALRPEQGVILPPPQ